MAMFDLKDSKDVSLNECHTDSSELLKGERLDRLKVSSSSTFSVAKGTPESPLSSMRKVLEFLAGHVVSSIFGLGVTLLAAYLAWRFGWGG